MKAKNRFYALGQRAKAHGINRVRAIRHFHIEDAPKWAKQAFIAGWEDAACEDTIEWRYEDLSDRAKERVGAWLWDTTYDWWDSVYEMAHEDAEERGIDIDSLRGSTRTSLCFDQYKNVNFDGTIDMSVALKDHTDPQYALWHALVNEGYVVPKVGIKDGRLGDIDIEYSESWLFTSGPLTGASCYEIMTALDSNGFITQVEKDLQACVTSFCDHVGKMLEEEENYMQSEEYVAEMCAANEYVFDEDGEIL